MRTSLVVFLSAVVSVVAQLTVNTPVGALTCLNQLITWTGGTGPYTLQIQPGGDPSAAAYETFTGLTGTSYSWFVRQPANTQIFVRLRDNTGLTAESGVVTIQPGGTCSSTTGGASTTAGGTPAPGTTAPGGTTTPAAPTTTGGAAGTTTAAPGGTSNAASGTGSTTARASTSTSNAMVSAKVAGGVVAAVAGAVALLA